MYLERLIRTHHFDLLAQHYMVTVFLPNFKNRINLTPNSTTDPSECSIVMPADTKGRTPMADPVIPEDRYFGPFFAPVPRNEGQSRWRHIGAYMVLKAFNPLSSIDKSLITAELCIGFALCQCLPCMRRELEY